MCDKAAERVGIICCEMRNKNMVAVRRCSCTAVDEATSDLVVQCCIVAYVAW